MEDEAVVGCEVAWADLELDFAEEAWRDVRVAREVDVRVVFAVGVTVALGRD